MDLFAGSLTNLRTDHLLVDLADAGFGYFSHYIDLMWNRPLVELAAIDELHQVTLDRAVINLRAGCRHMLPQDSPRAPAPKTLLMHVSALVPDSALTSTSMCKHVPAPQFSKKRRTSCT